MSRRPENISDVDWVLIQYDREERDIWKRWAQTQVKLDPGISEARFRGKLNAADFPLPDGKSMSRTRRQDLMTTYITNAGGFEGLKALLINYPIEVILRICPENGMPTPSPADVVAIKIYGDRAWGFNGCAPDCFTEDVWDTEVEGRLVKQILSGTVDGVLLKVSHSINLDGSHGPWEIEP